MQWHGDGDILLRALPCSFPAVQLPSPPPPQRMHQTRSVLDVVRPNAHLFLLFLSLRVFLFSFLQWYRRCIDFSFYLFFIERTCVVRGASREETKVEVELCERKQVWISLRLFASPCYLVLHQDLRIRLSILTARTLYIIFPLTATVHCAFRHAKRFSLYFLLLCNIYAVNHRNDWTQNEPANW